MGLQKYIYVFHLEVMYCQGKMHEIVQDFFLRLILEMSLFLRAGVENKFKAFYHMIT
jgi:hypothetical protein